MSGRAWELSGGSSYEGGRERESWGEDWVGHVVQEERHCTRKRKRKRKEVDEVSYEGEQERRPSRCVVREGSYRTRGRN